MAFGHGKSARLYGNGYNLSGFIKEVSFTATADVAESSVLGLTSKTYEPGLKDATMSISGYIDLAAAAIDEILAAALGAAAKSVFSYMPQADTLGLPAYGFSADETSYNPDTPVDDMGNLSADFQSSVGAERCLVHHILKAETTVTNETSVNGLAQTLTGGVGYFQATAFTGTNITVAIQDSADNITFVDRLIFAQITAAIKSERKVYAGTVKQYTRCAWTGTFTTCTFSAIFGRT